MRRLVLMSIALAGFPATVMGQPQPPSRIHAPIEIARPDVPPESQPEFELAVESVGFTIRQDFGPIDDKARVPEFIATEITPRFVVRPLVGRPILGSEPRVRLSRFTSPDGVDLLAAGAALAPKSSMPWQGRSPFVYFAADPDRTSLGVSFPLVLRPRTPAISIDRVPEAIGVLEGDLTVDVVEEDDTREFTLGKVPKRVEIAPGVTFFFEPGEPWAQASVSVDPAAAQGREPIVNYVRYFAGPGVVSIPREMTVPFRPAPPEDAPVIARAKFMLLPGFVTAHAESHVVLRTRSVTMPFRVENLVLTGAARPTQPRPPAPTDFQASRDGYALRLALLSARGSRSPTPSTDSSWNSNPRQPLVTLGLDITDTTGGRAYGWFTACRVDAATDESGARIYAAPAVGSERSPSVFERSFFPGKALPTKEPSNSDKGDGRRTRSAGFTVAALPTRFGTIRGTVEFAEVERDLVREVKLVRGGEPIELAPGVRVRVREATSDPNIWASGAESVVVEFDLPADADRRPEAASPRLNMAQFISADGVVGRPIFNTSERQAGGRRTYDLGPPSYEAATIRLHVILETTPREIPFEFHDVPCTDR